MSETKMSFRLLQIVFFAILTTGCVQPVAPEVSVLDLQVKGLTLSHATLEAGLRIFNPNQVPVTIEEVTSTLELNGVRIAEGRTLRKLKIGAEEEGTLPLRLSSAYFDFVRLMNRMPRGEEVKFGLSGTIRLKGWRVANRAFTFNREGNVPLIESLLPD